MTQFLQFVVNGAVLGSVYVLVALGVTLVYGLTRLINFAHGEVVTVGALITYWLVSMGISYYIAILAAAVAGGIVGVLLDRGLFQFTRNVPISGLLVSLGIISVSQAIFTKMTAGSPRSIRSPIAGNLEFAGVVISWQRVFVLAVSAVLFLGLFIYLKKTQFGRATRGYAENPDAAAIMGIDGERVVLKIFAIGSAQAAVAGGLMVSLYAATPSMGTDLIVKAFAVALIGGLGSVSGALVAGLGIGFAESFGGAYISSLWTDAFGYILMLVVLMIRPTGLARGASGAHL